MRRVGTPALLLAVVGAALGARALARADDKPFTWDPHQRPKVVAGARTFYDYELADATRMLMGTKGEMTAITSHAASTESYRWVRHIRSVESGEIAEAEIKFERWRRDDAGVKDGSLEGRTLSLKRAQGKLAPHLDDEEGVTDRARRWLEEELFRRSGKLGGTEFVEDLLLPREPAPVTTGCEWTRDPKAVALGLLRTTDVDAQRSSVKGSLTEVRLERGVHYGKAVVVGALQVRKLDLSHLHFEDGVLVEIAWSYEGSLEPQRREDSTRSLKVSFSGRSKLGDSLEAETRSERTETLKCGPAKK